MQTDNYESTHFERILKLKLYIGSTSTFMQGF